MSERPNGAAEVATKPIEESLPVKSTATPLAETTPVANRATPKRSRRRRKRHAARTAAKPSSAKLGQLAKFPRHSVEKALRIPKAIYDQNAGKSTTVADAAQYSTGGKVNGPFKVEVASAKKYGFLESEDGKLGLQPRARKALAPQSATDRVNALREAVMKAPDISSVYSHYRGENLPDDQFLENAFIDKFGIPKEKVSEFKSVLFETLNKARLLEDHNGRKRVLDVTGEVSTDGAAS